MRTLPVNGIDRSNGRRVAGVMETITGAEG